MLVELERTDVPEGGDARGGDETSDPVLIPGNPVKMSNVMDGPDVAPPCVGEHTDEVLRADLGLDEQDLKKLRDAGVIA
jgi:crotonobetainyl-CoA:carnitine CoA-transferase CaiB-like acyl-CoA transferase